MTSNCYIIDTSSLVQLNRNNPIDVFPSIWKKIEGLIEKERFVAPKEVFKEISKNDDQLAQWAKEQKNLFLSPTERQIQIVKDILEKYPILINTESECDADPWVIALAIELATHPQKTIYKIKRIIVTEEKLRGNQIKIPFVSRQFSIDAIDIVSMFRVERWKF